MNVPIFILGLPRCRTAWLSLCLCALGVDCSHEGIRDHVHFKRYADELDGRLAEGPAGDAAPGLEQWIPEILARWPAARFAVISRDDREALESLVRVCPEKAAEIRRGWNSAVNAFKAAGDTLRARGAACRFVTMEGLRDHARAADLLQWLSGRRPSPEWMRRKQRLRVTSDIDLAECVARPRPAAPPARIAGLEQFNIAGLSAVLYTNGDFETVEGWWLAHTGEGLAEAALPPLGVIVNDPEGPCAAVWCYESYGAPVAEIAYPVTRPGLGLARSSAAICYAIAAAIHAAGKAYEPEAVFRRFKVFAPKGAVHALSKLGFRESLTERVAMTLTL